MATKSFSRSYIYMAGVGWALYVAAGALLWQNANFTLDAFAAANVPPGLRYSATIFIGLIESATAIFLLSPSTWSEIARDLKEEAGQALGGFSGNARTAGAIVASLLTASIIALVCATYVIDWRSTLEGLGLSLDTVSAQPYKVLLTITLVFGPEAASIIGFQVLRRARECAILQHEEDSRLSPAQIYVAELKRARIRQARQSAKTAPAWSPAQKP